jgi:hypothetical protein
VRGCRTRGAAPWEQPQAPKSPNAVITASSQQARSQLIATTRPESGSPGSRRPRDTSDTIPLSLFSILGHAASPDFLHHLDLTSVSPLGIDSLASFSRVFELGPIELGSLVFCCSARLILLSGQTRVTNMHYTTSS